MPLEFTTSYLKDSLSLFRYYKRLADGALAQITEEQLYAVLDPEAKWRSLSNPRGRSAEFNRRVETGKASQR